MLAQAEVKELLDDVFEEEALTLGGLVATHSVEDDLVWRLVRSLDAIRTRALRRLSAEPEKADAGAGKAGPDLEPHPAIQEFLLKLRRA